VQQPVDGEPGALPPEALEQLIAAVRSLGMDDVRRQITDAQRRNA
jgi:thioredoxin 1